jgi:Acetyltransferase (GNAT) domain
MAQQTLQTERITLVPLANEHFEWELELDSDPEVMRDLRGRASNRDEVEASHARRMAAARKVGGLGFWVGRVDDEFVGWWIMQPAHGPDQPDDPAVADLGFRLLRRHWRKGLVSEGRGSCSLWLRRHRARPDHRPDDEGQCGLAGRDGADRPRGRSRLPVVLNGVDRGCAARTTVRSRSLQPCLSR